MARPLRVEYPGAYYHVINRGNAGRNTTTESKRYDTMAQRQLCRLLQQKT